MLKNFGNNMIKKLNIYLNTRKKCLMLFTFETNLQHFMKLSTG